MGEQDRTGDHGRHLRLGGGADFETEFHAHSFFPTLPLSFLLRKSALSIESVFFSEEKNQKTFTSCVRRQIQDPLFKMRPAS
jgi:hypothetical protein